MNTVIVLFAYNRPGLLKGTIRALNRCKGIESYSVWVFSDGAKDEKDVHRVNEVRNILHDLCKDNNFAALNVIEREHNFGLANSVIAGVTYVFEKYDAVICIEDDLIVSDDFVNYMNSSLLLYEHDERIWSISGFCPCLESLEYIDKESFLFNRASSWGWGTWKDRWEKINWSNEKYSSMLNNPGTWKKMKLLGRDFPYLLSFQVNGMIDSWAVRWCASQWEKNMLTVYPQKSRVNHVGIGAEATHVKKTSIKQQVLSDHINAFTGEKAEYYETIAEEFRKLFYLNPIKAFVKIRIHRLRQG